MKQTNILDCLFIHTPKLNDYYKPIGSHFSIMIISSGLFAIAELLDRNGFSAKIVHLGIEVINNPKFSLRQYIKRTKPKVVGLSLHWHYQTYDILDISRKIKMIDEQILIVLGGYTASFFHKDILLDHKAVDCVIRGDGEKSMLELTKIFLGGSRDFSNVSNLTWRKGPDIIENDFSYIATAIDMDNLRFSNFKLLENFNLYIDYIRMPMLWIDNLSPRLNKFILQKQKFFCPPTTRGCPVNCSYCGGGAEAQKLINNRSEMIFRSPEKVLESISEAISFGYNSIYIELYPGHEEYLRRIFSDITQHKLNIYCLLNCCGLPNKEIIDRFKTTFRKGSQIYISPESGSEKIRRLNKGFFFSNQELFTSLEYIEKRGIDVVLFFILGLPYEQLGDINETRRLVKTLRRKFKRISGINSNIVKIEPASPVYLNPDKYNIKLKTANLKDFCLEGKKKRNSYFETQGYENLNFRHNLTIKGVENYDFEKEINKIKCNNFCQFTNYLIVQRYPRLAPAICGLAGYLWNLFPWSHKDKYLFG